MSSPRMSNSPERKTSVGEAAPFAGHGPQDIEQLTKRFETLREKKTRAQTQLEAAQETLERLKHQAREQYQTDDPAELEKKLAQITQENERKRSEYQQLLHGIEQGLSEVEQKYAAAGEG